VNITLHYNGHTCVNAKLNILVSPYTSALKSSKIRKTSKDVISLLKSCCMFASTKLATSNLEVFSGLPCCLEHRVCIKQHVCLIQRYKRGADSKALFLKLKALTWNDTFSSVGTRITCCVT
jgi:hypothetical protein